MAAVSRRGSIGALHVKQAQWISKHTCGTLGLSDIIRAQSGFKKSWLKPGLRELCL